MTVVNPKSISGINSITTPSGSDNLFTVHTNNTTERVRINNDGDVIVGSGITVSPDGDIFATGVCTATTFSGSGASLTNLPAANITGTLPAIDGSNLTNITSTTINNNANNRLITGSGTANTLEGEATLTYNGTDTFELQPASATPAVFVGDSNRTGAGQGIAHFKGNWNGTTVARITFDSGSDTTNKDDGIIRFDTAPSGSLSEAMRIGSSGYVNIGSADARKVLDITGPDGRSGASPGNSDTALIIDNDGGNGAIMEMLADNNAYGRIFFTDTDASNQGGIIYKHGDDSLNFQANGSERVSVSSGGNLTISDGDLVIGTSGHGIDFSATANAGNSASMSSELLDDYEEGSWVPDMHDGSVTANSCSYTKVGRLVTIVGFLYNFTDTSTNDQVKIGGLPYASAVNGVACGTVMYNNVSETNNTVLYMNSQSQLLQYGGDSGAFSQIRHNELNSSSTFYIFAQYMAAT